MRITSKHIRPSTIFFVVALAVLGSILLIQERKAARLRAALADYKRLSHERVADRLHGRALLNWAADAPLQQVIEEVKRCTSAARGWPVFPLGVPIEVDPIGLERAGRSLKSPVPSPPADVDLTLGEKLRAVLEPLGLACDVRDASVVITARDMVTSPVELKESEDE